MTDQKRKWHPFRSITTLWIVTVIAFAGFTRYGTVQNCHANQHSHDAIDRVWHAALNPPSLQGRPESDAQRHALNVYSTSLRDANGPRPSCPWL